MYTQAVDSEDFKMISDINKQTEYLKKSGVVEDKVEPENVNHIEILYASGGDCVARDKMEEAQWSPTSILWPSQFAKQKTGIDALVPCVYFNSLCLDGGDEIVATLKTFGQKLVRQSEAQQLQDIAAKSTVKTKSSLGAGDCNGASTLPDRDSVQAFLRNAYERHKKTPAIIHKESAITAKLDAELATYTSNKSVNAAELLHEYFVSFANPCRILKENEQCMHSTCTIISDILDEEMLERRFQCSIPIDLTAKTSRDRIERDVYMWLLPQRFRPEKGIDVSAALDCLCDAVLGMSNGHRLVFDKCMKFDHFKVKDTFASNLLCDLRNKIEHREMHPPDLTNVKTTADAWILATRKVHMAAMLLEIHRLVSGKTNIVFGAADTKQCTYIHGDLGEDDITKVLFLNNLFYINGTYAIRYNDGAYMSTSIEKVLKHFN